MGWIIGKGIGVPFRMGGSGLGSSYWIHRHPELATYIDGLVTPLSEAQIIRLGEFIETLKTGLSITNLSDAFDVLYVLNGETSESSLKNLVSDNYHATLEGTTLPTFMAFEGFVNTGEGYINTHYNPASHASKFSRNNGSIGHYQLTNINHGAPVPIWGAYDGLSPYRGSGNVSHVVDGANYFSAYASINTMRYNSSRGYSNYCAPISSIGMHIASRLISTEESYYFNKVQSSVHSLLAQAFFDAEIYLLGRNNGTACDVFNTDKLSFWYIGRGVTSDEVDTITDGFFFDILNMNVIENSRVDLTTLAVVPLTTYDGSGETVHPSVVDVGEDWNGYRYWMANTPYPTSDPAYENPSIWASSDGITWVVPDGLTNPIYDKPEGDYNADTDLFYNESDNKLYVIWKKSTTGATLMLSSSDGVTWENLKTVVSVISGEDSIVCPSIIKIGTRYFIYYFTYGSEVTDDPRWMRVSCDSIDGVYGGRELINAPPPSGKFFWHGDVILINNIYWMAGMASGGTGQGYEIHVMKSTDGINFIRDTYPTMITARKEMVALSINAFYRPTIEMIAGQPILYFTTRSTTNIWGLAKVNIELD